MDLIGKKVKHNKFGEGVITQQDVPMFPSSS